MSQPYRPPCDQELIAAQPCPEAGGYAPPAAQRAWVLAACVLASAMAFIDGSALTVALPDLRRDLNAELHGLQWVINAYVLALAALTLVGGALADRFGKAKILAWGCLGFGLASVACALASGLTTLVAARALQGVAAALLTPASLALIGATYPKAQRNQAIGIWAAASALTTAGGPVLGGWLTSQWGWQAVFWINPPVAILVLLLLWRFAPRPPREDRQFDWWGAALLALSLALIAWGLSQWGSTEARVQTGSGATPVPWLLAGLIGLLGYGWWEWRAPAPTTPPRLLGDSPLLRLNAATFLLYAGLSVAFFVLPFDWVERRGLSPTQAGWMFLPFSLVVGVMSRWFGGLYGSGHGFAGSTAESAAETCALAGLIRPLDHG